MTVHATAKFNITYDMVSKYIEWLSFSEFRVWFRVRNICREWNNSQSQFFIGIILHLLVGRNAIILF